MTKTPIEEAAAGDETKPRAKAQGSKKATHNGPPGALPPDSPPDRVRIEWARRLQRRMTGKGMNQSDLARAAGIGRDNISKYIVSGAIPSPGFLAKIAKALDCEPEDLLPTKGIPRVDAVSPSFEITDAGGNHAWLRINQAVPWNVALEIAKLIKLH